MVVRTRRKLIWEIRERKGTVLSEWLRGENWGGGEVVGHSQIWLGWRGNKYEKRWEGLWRIPPIALMDLGCEVHEPMFKEYLILSQPKGWRHFEGLSHIGPFFVQLFLHFTPPLADECPIHSSNPKSSILFPQASSGLRHPSTGASPPNWGGTVPSSL